MSTITRHERLDTPQIRLREDRFNAATTSAGYRTDVARAELLKISERTINRARNGVIGKEFIAKTLDALRAKAEELPDCHIEHTFDEIFEVTRGSR